MSNSSSSLYVPTTLGANSFRLKHKGDPIFLKTFDASSINIVDIDNDIITLKNHFFKTGEKLTYKVPDRGSPIEISPLSPGNSISTTFLPEEVYPIVVDSNKIKLAFTEQLALSGSQINITGIGTGKTHTLECEKQNTKCLITIDNIIQSPLSIGSTVEIESIVNSRNIILKNLSNISEGTVLKIDSELCKVVGVLYSETSSGVGTVTLLRGVNVLGTNEIELTNDLKYVTIMSGQYNIVQDKIYFTDSPFEGRRFTYKVEISDLDEGTFSFNLFNTNIETGSIISLASQNPPSGLIANRIYFAIKNYENNYSFANTYQDAVNGEKVEFDKDLGNYDVLAPVEPFNLTFFDFSFGSSFSGRAFLRSNYSGNAVFDDISNQFNGISSSFELKNSGLSTTGISTDNGVVLVNNIFQYPEFEESFSYVEQGGQTLLKFVGIGTTGDPTKSYDVNVKGFPRGGIIVGYGLSSGSKYQPLRGAILYETTKNEISENQYQIDGTNIGIAFSGSGYRYSPGYAVSVYFEQEGVRISGFGTATITSGNITSINITTPCTYTGISTPTVKIDPPLQYDNLDVFGSTSGIGAKVNLKITDDGKIGEFKFINPGYGYTVGEILTLPQLISLPDQTSQESLKIIILSTGKDTFSAWNLGKLRKLDDLTPDINGTRRVFNLTENGQLLSLETLPGSEIEIQQNVLVFFNDVLQIPGESYTFNGGTQIIMSEAPPLGSTLKVYFYMGSDGDAFLFDIDPKVKVGDSIKVKKGVSKEPQTQNSRTVKRIISSDSLKTEIYKGKGLSYNSFTYRSSDFTPQSKDLLINGEIVSKSRESLKSRYVGFSSIASLSGNFATTNTTVIELTTTNIQVGDIVDSEFTDSYVVTDVGISSITIGQPATNDTTTGLYPVKVWRKLS